MPKRGVETSTTRRSRSSLRPVTSACTGAEKPSAAASPGKSCESRRERGAGGLGLLEAVAESLARAFVDDDDGHRGQRLAVLAGERGIGEREREQRQRRCADQRAAAADEEQ